MEGAVPERVLRGAISRSDRSGPGSENKNRLSDSDAGSAGGTGIRAITYCWR